MSQIFKSEGGSPAADVETLSGNIGGPVGPDAAFNISITGLGNLLVTGTPAANNLEISEVSPAIRTLTGDVGTAVSPDGGGDITITGSGNITVTGTPASNNLDISQTGPLITCGTGSTIDVGTVDLVTIDLGGSAAAFTLRAIIVGKAATASATGGQVVATLRTDGAAATLVDTPDTIENADLAIAASSFTFVVSGNDVILRAFGALGSTISWNACVEQLSVIAGF